MFIKQLKVQFNFAIKTTMKTGSFNGNKTVQTKLKHVKKSFQYKT